MLDKQLCPSIGQVPAPDLLKQDLNTECTRVRWLCLQAKTVVKRDLQLNSEAVVCLSPLPIGRDKLMKPRAPALGQVLISTGLVMWEHKGYV